MLILPDSEVTSMGQSTSPKHELNALKLELKYCTEQIEKLKGEVSELKENEVCIKQIKKLRGEVNELKKEVEATCKEVDSTRHTIHRVTELLSYK